MADYSPRTVEILAYRQPCTGGTVFARAVRTSLDDTSTPVISGFSPAGGALLAKNDAITFDVTDELVDGEFTATLLVSVYLVSVDTAEVAWNGDEFENKYATSTRSSIANGYRFVIRRTGGWPTGGVRVKVRAVDRGGNIGTL